MNTWDILGIAPTSNERDIKRAYAKRLKVTRPEDGLAEFQALRDAYEAALRMAPYVDGEDEEAVPAEPAASPPSPAPAVSAPAVSTPPSPPAAVPPSWNAPPPLPTWDHPPLPRQSQPQPVPGYRPPAPPPGIPPAPPVVGEAAVAPPVPSLRDAPDLALLEQRRREAEERARELARAQARAASEAALATAQRLWSNLLEQEHGNPELRLRQLAQSDDMLNLEVRDHVELFALQYCAGEACTDELRELLADFFLWREDGEFASSRLPEAVEQASARLRIGRAYAKLLARAKTEPAVAALLEDTPGRRYPRLLWRDFTHPMRAELARIRLEDPELLESKLDLAVFEEWERRVAGPRYFIETAVAWVFLGNLTLVLALKPGVPELPFSPGVSLALCTLLALAVSMGLTWYQPLERLRKFGWIQDKVRELSTRPWLQYGWIPAYALFSASMFIPAPSTALVWSTSIGLLVATLAGGLANQLVHDKIIFAVGAAMALALGWLLRNAFPAYGTPVAFVGAYGALMLHYRGGINLWDRVKRLAPWFLPLRCVWLAGVGALLAMLSMSPLPLPLPLYSALAWLWLLAGTQLSHPGGHHGQALIGAFFVLAMLTGTRPPDAPIRDTPLALLIFFTVTVAIQMVMNMRTARKNQHPFT